jgi:hypothetical protein
MNEVAFKILPMDPERLTHPVLRSLMTMVTDPIIGERLVNWDDVVSGMVALFKAHVHRAESLDQPSSYFSAVLERVYEGDPRLVRRFVDLWDATPGSYPEKVSWMYSLVWRTPEVGELRFRGFVNSVNEVLCLDIDDWIPADPESFKLLATTLAAQ